MDRKFLKLKGPRWLFKTGMLAIIASLPHIVHAGAMGPSSASSPRYVALPFFDYSYFDFKYNSEAGLNFNRFQGHSNQYRLGGDLFIPSITTMGGIYLYRVDTDLTSNLALTPSLPVLQTQSIKNNIIYGHISKFVGIFGVDVGGAYGSLKLNNQVIQSPHTAIESIGFGSARDSSNWYASVAALFSYPWRQFNLSGSLQYLHAEANYKAFLLNFVSPVPNTAFIAPLTSKGGWVSENAKLEYRLNSVWTPYVSGSLIQVTQFNYSRSLVDGAILGGLPQFALNKNGFIVGGGLTAQLKQWKVSVEDNYYQTGNLYHSNQVLVRLAVTWC